MALFFVTTNNKKIVDLCEREMFPEHIISIRFLPPTRFRDPRLFRDHYGVSFARHQWSPSDRGGLPGEYSENSSRHSRDTCAVRRACYRFLVARNRLSGTQSYTLARSSEIELAEFSIRTRTVRSFYSTSRCPFPTAHLGLRLGDISGCTDVTVFIAASERSLASFS